MGLLGSFLGKDQRKDIQAANQQANQYLDTGYNAANADYGQAIAGYDPYVQGGGAANDFYRKALGLGTDAERTTAINTLTSNPLFQDQAFTNVLAAQRGANAQGYGAGGFENQSGFGAAAMRRAFLDTSGSWLDRYNNLGQQGLQATGAKSNALMGRADLATNYASTKAGNAVNYGNALAANRSTGLNNILQLGGLAVSGINAWRQPTNIGTK